VIFSTIVFLPGEAFLVPSPWERVRVRGRRPAASRRETFESPLVLGSIAGRGRVISCPLSLE